jgi:FtsP/CotA-like multicopper oxidase with cupredoxin domain
MKVLLVAVVIAGAAPGASAKQMDHQHHNMQVTSSGVVMNENKDKLPRDCDAISRDYEITIHGGRDYASKPGMIFGLSEHEVRVEPCSRITVTFINDDDIRHQWMVHGLPKYLYPAGMFHIEANGGNTRTGTFIVPAEDRNFLIHCDIAQHMEKGMRGQLVVGKGSGDLWGVAKVSSDFIRADYAPASRAMIILVTVLAGFLLTSLLIARR